MKTFTLLYDFGGYAKDQKVYEYLGCTYGCCSPDEIAITALPDKTPFLGVPAHILIESHNEPESTPTQKELDELRKCKERLEFYFGNYRAEGDNTILKLELRALTSNPPTIEEWKKGIDSAIEQQKKVK